MTRLNKILYVEDQEDIQTIVKVALESISNFELTICSSGEEAISTLAKVTPDLLLIDVMMPKMDGPTLVKTIQERDDLPNLPVIYITAKVHANDIKSIMSTGALSVITKPFDPVTLGTQIQNIWNKHCT